MRLTEYDAKINKNNGLTELYKCKAYNYDNPYPTLYTPETVYKMLTTIYSLDEKAEEYVYMISLNTRCKPIGIFNIAKGTVNSCIMPIRETFIRALLSGAVFIIIVHNHPSGDTTPSADDIKVTKKLNDAGELIGIKLLDHIIIGNSFLSMKSNGYY